MFFITSEVDKHHHVLYQPEGINFFLTSNNDGHTHEVEMEEDGIITIKTSDGHTHDAFEFIPEDESSSVNEKELLKKVLLYYDEASKLEEESIKSGREAEEMLMHNQWKSKDLPDNPTKPALTINRLEEKLDNLSGFQRQNRTDFRFFPTENGDNRVADILNIVVKDINEQCFYGREETKVFEDAYTTGKGVFHIYEDRDRVIEGEIKTERFQWDECYFGAHSKDDASDADFVLKEKWFTLDKLKGIYPDKLKLFEPELKKRAFDSGISQDWDKRLSSVEFVDAIREKFKVIECELKEYKRYFVLVNKEDGFVQDAKGWSMEDIESAKSLGFSAIKRKSFTIRRVQVTADILLDEEELDRDYFTMIPLYGKRNRDIYWGKIEGVKDLQRLINKTYSQFTDIINKVANYIYYYDGETFKDRKEEANWRKNATTPGYTAKLVNVDRRPIKEEGIKFPTEIVNAIEMFNIHLREILNVSVDLEDKSGRMSGAAIRKKILQQVQGNAFLFDNLSFVKKIIGRIYIKLIKKLYTTDRILRVIGNQANENTETTIGGETVDPKNQEQMAEIEKLLNTVDLESHDVNISEAPNSPSAMIGNFMLLLDMAEKTGDIPGSALLEYAPLPGKKKILDIIARQQELQQAELQSKNQTEITKTLIANQSNAQ